MFNEMMPVTMPNVDLSQDTVTPDKVFLGYTFHDKDDQPQVGTYDPFVMEVSTLGSTNQLASSYFCATNVQTGAVSTNFNSGSKYFTVSYNSSNTAFTITFKKSCYIKYQYNGSLSAMIYKNVGDTLTFNYKYDAHITVYSRASL